MKLRVLAGVHQETVRIAAYYEQRQTGLGVRFLDNLEAALELIEKNPLGYPRLESIETERNIRRVVLGDFPYLLIYEIAADEAVAVALRHGSQEPGTGIPGGRIEPRD